MSSVPDRHHLPTLILFSGIGVGATLMFLVGAKSADYDLNYYPVGEALGWFVYGLACTASLGWTARQTTQRSVRCWTGGCAVLAALITAAILFDLLYIAVGPGVPPMANTCFGGMDCIGEPLPGPPLTGDGQLLACAGILSLPVAATMVLASSSSLKAPRGGPPAAAAPPPG